MKTILLILAVWLTAVSARAAQTNGTVMFRVPDGLVMAPTNIWAANSNQINAILRPSGTAQPASGNLTNWSGIGTNRFTTVDQGNLYQTGSANLTNWSGVPTNVLGTSLTNSFSIILLGDQQNFAEIGFWRPYFHQMWTNIEAHVASDNIKAVLHTGDHLNDNVGWQTNWPNWTNELVGLPVPYVYSVGNHDFYDGAWDWSDGLTNLDLFIGQNFLTNRVGWRGGFEFSGTARDYYMELNNNPIPVLVLSLEFGPSVTNMTWGSNVLSSHPGWYTILLTHAYLDESGRRTQVGDLYTPATYSKPGGWCGDEMWTNAMRLWPDLRMTLNGHEISGLPIAHLTDTGVYGNGVESIFFNTQDDYLDGPWLLELTFYPAQGRYVARMLSTQTWALGAAVSLGSMDISQASFSGPMWRSGSNTVAGAAGGNATNAQPPSLNLTNWSGVPTNVLSKFQTGSVNLTNWSGLDTNVLTGLATDTNAGMPAGISGGLVLYTPFLNEGTNTVHDYSGYANPGTWYDWVTGLTPGSNLTIGVSGSAANFATPAQIGFTQTNQFNALTSLSISVWFNTVEQNAVGTLKMLVCHYLSAATGGWELDHYGSNQLRFKVVVANTGINLIGPASNANNGLWHHAAAVYDGVGMSLWYDGGLMATQAQAGPIQASAIPLTLGSFDSDAYHFIGSLDEVAVWGRALSASEIQQLYQQFALPMNYSMPNGIVTGNGSGLTNVTAKGLVVASYTKSGGGVEKNALQLQPEASLSARALAAGFGNVPFSGAPTPWLGHAIQIIDTNLNQIWIPGGYDAFTSWTNGSTGYVPWVLITNSAYNNGPHQIATIPDKNTLLIVDTLIAETNNVDLYPITNLVVLADTLVYRDLVASGGTFSGTLAANTFTNGTGGVSNLTSLSSTLGTVTATNLTVTNLTVQGLKLGSNVVYDFGSRPLQRFIWSGLAGSNVVMGATNTGAQSWLFVTGSDGLEDQWWNFLPGDANQVARMAEVLSAASTRAGEGTNFTLTIGANGTNYTLTVGGYGTNFALGLALACSNLAYAIGTSATNLGAAVSNGAVSAAVAIGAASTNAVAGLSNSVAATYTPINSPLTNVMAYTNASSANLAMTCLGAIVLSNASGQYTNMLYLAGDNRPLGSNAVIAVVLTNAVVASIGTNGFAMFSGMSNTGSAYFNGNVSAQNFVFGNGGAGARLQSAGNNNVVGGIQLQGTVAQVSTNQWILQTTNQSSGSLNYSNGGVSFFVQRTNVPAVSGTNIINVLSIGDPRQNVGVNGQYIVVGIGTNKPQAMLHVGGNSEIDGYICLGNTNSFPPTISTTTSNLCYIYSKTAGATQYAELWVQDGATNSTQISPHSTTHPDWLTTNTLGTDVVSETINGMGAHRWVNLHQLARNMDAIVAKLGLDLPKCYAQESADEFYDRLQADPPEVQAQIDAALIMQDDAAVLGIDYQLPDFVAGRLDQVQRSQMLRGGGALRGN